MGFGKIKLTNKIVKSDTQSDVPVFPYILNNTAPGPTRSAWIDVSDGGVSISTSVGFSTTYTVKTAYQAMYGMEAQNPQGNTGFGIAINASVPDGVMTSSNISLSPGQFVIDPYGPGSGTVQEFWISGTADHPHINIGPPPS